MLIIRPSTDADLPSITAIYAHHVLTGTGTFEVDPPSVEDMRGRRADVLNKGLPWLVAVTKENGDEKILGYAYCNWFKPRPAYRFSAEDSIYLSPEAVGKGLGRTLLAELMAQAQRAGVRKLIAVIGDSANAGSIGVHQSAGFKHVGVLKSCGWKFDKWLDVVLMDKALGEADITAPDRHLESNDMKNKTIAAWLSFLGGPIGLHRFYLFGKQDWLGWLLPLPTILGLYGVQRVRAYGIDDTISWVLLPVLGFVIAGCALTAIVYGLMSAEQWNARFNPKSKPDAAAGQTSWLTIGAVVFSLLIGCTALIFGTVQVFQHYFEYQILEGQKLSQ